MICSRRFKLAGHCFLRSLIPHKHYRMVYLIAIPLLFLTLMATTAMAASVTVSWDINPDDPDGYIVHIRQADGTYDYNQPVWVGNITRCRLDGLAPSTEYAMIVRAYNTEGQSDDSNEVTFTTPADTAANTINQTPKSKSRVLVSAVDKKKEAGNQANSPVQPPPALQAKVDVSK